ncbi:zinc finger protein OZF-like, partial [Contarinia nasturtii]|uniref:zinc finger protein OZF-like n=1 Tax=Contarinia nasturtii TaxID=265458 RepID=UPI0012D43D6A
MNPYSVKGTLGGKSKRRCKCKHAASKVTIKEEVVVKEEPRDGAELIHFSPAPSPISINVNGTVKSESESDSESSTKYDLDCVKKEIKSEDEEECSKKNWCSSTQDDGSNQRKGDNRSGDRRHRSGQNTHNNKGQRGRKSKSKKRIGEEKPKIHKCHLCSYTTSHKGTLNSHLRIHTGEKPSACEICAKTFSHKHALNRHKKVHANEYPFHCPKCRRGFEQKVEKIEHENQCQQRQYQCIVCKYTTDRLASLKQHMAIHSDEKPFQCRVCSKTFKRKYHLCQHLRTHTKHLPFACSKCGQRFAEESCKKTHEDRCNRRRFECYLCPYKCFKKSHLKYHMQLKHIGEKQFQCKVCDKKFVLKCQLKTHLKMHAKPRPIRCIKCYRRFANEDDKNAHEKYCSRRHYECYI